MNAKRYQVDIYVGPPLTFETAKDATFRTVEVEAANPLHAKIVARNTYDAHVALQPRLIQRR
jgi:hypothetical protein